MSWTAAPAGEVTMAMRRGYGGGVFYGSRQTGPPSALFLQLLKGHTQVAGALGRQAGAVQLVGAVAGIDANTAGGDDLHTVFRAEAQARGAAPEHNALQTALAVLQRKVVMAGGVYLIVGELAPRRTSCKAARYPAGP